MNQASFPHLLIIKSRRRLPQSRAVNLRHALLVAVVASLSLVVTDRTRAQNPGTIDPNTVSLTKTADFTLGQDTGSNNHAGPYAIDSGGNYYVTNTIDLGDNPPTIISKFTHDGQLAWRRQRKLSSSGGNFYEQFSSDQTPVAITSSDYRCNLQLVNVAVDDQGNFFAAFNEISPTADPTTGYFNSLRVLLVKFDANGVFQWRHVTPDDNGTNPGSNTLYSMKVTASRSVVGIGTTSNGGGQPFVFKYGADGTRLFDIFPGAGSEPSSSLNPAASIASDAADNVFIKTYGTDALTIRKLDLNGNVTATVSTPIPSDSRTPSDNWSYIACDPAGNLYAAGIYYRERTDLSDPGDSKQLLAKFDPNLHQLWRVIGSQPPQPYTDPTATHVIGIGISPGGVTLAGYWRDMGINANEVDGAWQTTRFSLDDGHTIWTRSYQAAVRSDGSRDDSLSAFYVDNDDNVYLAGLLTGTNLDDEAVGKYAGNGDLQFIKILPTPDFFVQTASLQPGLSYRPTFYQSAGASRFETYIVEVANPADVLAHQPPPPPQPGLSATTFTVNGSATATSNNLGGTTLHFAAQQSGTASGIFVRVQSTTTPNTESSWTDLPTGISGFMRYDSKTQAYILNTTSYPAQNGIYFRAIAAAGAYQDSISNVVGPFNLTSNLTSLGPTTLDRVVINGTLADLYFTVTHANLPANGVVRIQSSTTPQTESSWADLADGNNGHMQPRKDANQFYLLENNAPAGTGIYFRAIASAPGAMDSISISVGPYDIIADTPPIVTLTPPPALPNSGDGHSVNRPILVAAGTFQFGATAQTSRTLKKLALQVDGETKYEAPVGANTVQYTIGGLSIGDHVLEAFAVDDLGGSARSGTGAIYIRIVSPSAAFKGAARSPTSAVAANTAQGKTFIVINSGGDWSDPATWSDQDGNQGIPGANDSVIIGGNTVYIEGTEVQHAQGVSLNGGAIARTASSSGQLVIHGQLTVYGGELDVDVTILAGATAEFAGDKDPVTGQDTLVEGQLDNYGTLNIHGSAGIYGLTNFNNYGSSNFQLPLHVPTTAGFDPAADGRVISATAITHSGTFNGLNIDNQLISQDGSSIISNDGSTLALKLISSNSGKIISEGGAGLISQDGSSVISHNGGNLITDLGSGVISHNGGNIVSTYGNGTAPSARTRAEAATTGFVQSGGNTNLSAVTIVGPMTLNGGVISGSGAILGDLTNNTGFIAPGHSAGIVAVTGNFIQNNGGSLVLESGGAAATQFDQLQVGGAAALGGNLDIKLINGYSPAAQDTFNPIGFRSVSGSFAKVSSNAQLTVGTTGVVAGVDTTKPNPTAGQPLNIATRLAVQGGDNVLIAGFIVTGPSGSTKKVLIRGIGPSLANFGVAGTISDPLLELHKPDGTVFTNDNWQQGDTTQIPNGFAPSDPRESVIVATLAPGNYSAVLKGAHGETGVGLAEVYDLEPTSTAELGNIATRGFVNTGDNVMIGGFIVGGTEPAKILVRATGPSLTAFGVQGALPATTLELHDSNGGVISNDGWRNTQEAEIQSTHLQPSNDNEAAILATLVPGNYTAVVRGKDNNTGIGLVEAYNLP